MMDTNNVERNLRSLRRLYNLLLQSNANNESIPEPFLLDENTQFLLKSLLDYATNEILARQSKIIAAAQLGLPETIPLSNVPDTSATVASQALERTRINNASQIKRIGGSLLRANGSFKPKGQSEQVTDSIERIETVLSALSFRSSRVESDDDTRSCKSRSVTPIEEHSPSLRSSVNEATEAILGSRDDRTLPHKSQRRGSLPPDDQFVRVKSRAPLPPLPVNSVVFKKPSQSKRMSQKMRSIKPTLLDQETESSENEKTWSETSSDGEELVSSEQESEETFGESEESRSSSGSSWETQGESVSGEEKSLGESNSSYSSQSEDDESEVSASPSPKKRDKPPKQRKKAVMGRFTRFKNKFGQALHLHQHHHHHHHPHGKEEGRKPSAWNHLQKALHYKRKEKAVEKRMKTEFKGLTTTKNRGGHFHGLVEGLMRHRKRSSTKQKNKLPSHGRKKHWWQTYKRQGRLKFPTKGRAKLGKRPYLLKRDPET